LIINGLDGKEYSWNPSTSEAKCSKRSSLHIKAKDLLDKLFPYDRILEEVSLAGSKTERRRSTLRADLFIPNRNLIIEVHGEQHYKFNKFFYKDKLSFYRAKARDSEKKEWCHLNDITLIEFNYNEDLDEWRRKIK
jgi:very-short-patch-repair endonuclease|tara:strand:- start:2433 stop:2840 length:408 start_codon:yes stop_codon:yes gene_type:complete